MRNPPKTSKGAYEKGGASELARRTGTSETAIRDYLKLLDLEREVQAAVQEKKRAPLARNLFLHVYPCFVSHVATLSSSFFPVS